jgi:hypothetical protein
MLASINTMIFKLLISELIHNSHIFHSYAFMYSTSPLSIIEIL